MLSPAVGGVMNHIDTAIDIDAPAETVWAVLTDFTAYPEWNPRTRITGEAAVGERLTVAPGPEAEGMPTFRPRVLAAGPVEHDASPDDGASDASELRWLGHLYVRGLFDGEHSFLVEAVDDDRSRLTQSETFSGLLAGLVLRRYGADTEAGFHDVNAALKIRAEAAAAGGPAVESATDDAATAATTN
jgi:hypothetical protein